MSLRAAATTATTSDRRRGVSVDRLGCAALCLDILLFESPVCVTAVVSGGSGGGAASAQLGLDFRSQHGVEVVLQVGRERLPFVGLGEVDRQSGYPEDRPVDLHLFVIAVDCYCYSFICWC